jgi:hypothetical protein
MRTLLAAGAVASGLTLLAALAVPSGASNPPPVSLQAHYVGTDEGTPCVTSGCAIEAESQYCEAVGMRSGAVPFGGTCSASLSGTMKTRLVNGVRVCVTGGTGTLHYVDALGDDMPLPVSIDVAHGVASFHSTPVVGAPPGIGVIQASGTVKPACIYREGVKQVFQGSVTYLRTP